jgi:kynureninase
MSHSLASVLSFSPEEDFARGLDRRDPLAEFRERFHIPRGADGQRQVYLAGNSLGLQPISVKGLVEQELQDWAEKGVAGHFEAATPWYDYHRHLTGPLAALAGAKPSEVVAMNSLTVNLHLMMASFYRPTLQQHRILMEDCAFPSDTYAVKSQIAYHGFEPAESLLVAKPRAGEDTLRTEDLLALLDEKGEEIALVLLGGVNYFTGQAFDLHSITEAAQRRGCLVGFDLAHALGNIPLSLHDWSVDFAVWCSYKYLNAGPGAVAGCFIHERHGSEPALPRFSGWWGNDPETRFRMHLLPDFAPLPGAEGWQLSNPPILSMAPLRASLDLFQEAGMEALRAKSILLTAYLEYLLRGIPGGAYRIITPADPAQRGCQLSVGTKLSSRILLQSLQAQGIVADFREPDVLRFAPVPLYNRFVEVWRLGQALREAAVSS